MIISIVDDDEDFCNSLRRWTTSFLKKHSDLSLSLNVYRSSKELFLSLRGADGEQASKTLLILDLDFDGNKTAGIDALARIRRSRRAWLRNIPIIMYSNSDDESEIAACYRRKANSYVWKGFGSKQKDRFIEIVHYWASTASIPSE
jgi:CheY-like chemotaxis protein